MTNNQNGQIPKGKVLETVMGEITNNSNKPERTVMGNVNPNNNNKLNGTVMGIINSNNNTKNGKANSTIKPINSGNQKKIKVADNITITENEALLVFFIRHYEEQCKYSKNGNYNGYNTSKIKQIKNLLKNNYENYTNIETVKQMYNVSDNNDERVDELKKFLNSYAVQFRKTKRFYNQKCNFKNPTYDHRDLYEKSKIIYLVHNIMHKSITLGYIGQKSTIRSIHVKRSNDLTVIDDPSVPKTKGGKKNTKRKTKRNKNTKRKTKKNN